MSKKNIGKYIELEQIGRGGMAEVYIGTDPTLHRKVAIKLILPHLADKSDFETRFQREAKAIANLRHSNIVQIYEYSVEDGTPFMVMEYLKGKSLEELLAAYKAQGRTMPLDEVANILEKIANGLDYAHNRGLVHRDIKPSNILFSDDGEPIIADFGIVKMLDEATVLTHTGGIVGTPHYLPPEQASQKEIDKRGDIYSLGIMLYQMVTGEVPFVGDVITVMMQHVNTPPKNPVILNPELPEGIANVILKALEKDPDDRYSSAGEMARAFRRALTGTDQVPQAVTAPSISTDLSTSQPPAESSFTGEKRPSKAINTKMIGGIVGVLVIGGGIGILAIALIAYIVFGDGLRGIVSDALTPTPSETSGEVLPLVVATSAAENLEVGQSEEPTATITIAQIEEATPSGDQPATESTAIPIDTTIARGDITFNGSILEITLNDLFPPGEGFIYAAWLTEPDSPPLFLGTVDPAGGEISFTDPEGRDLLMNFSGFAITEESSSSEPAFSGPIIFEAQVDPQVILDYRHLMNLSTVSLDQAIRVQMLTQAKTFNSHVGFSISAILESSSLDNGKSHAEHSINIASGSNSVDYFDWNENGQVENPGDEVGLLVYARLFANALTIDGDELAGEADDLIAQIEEHVSLMKKINVSDTLDEARIHAEQLQAEQGQVLEKINALLDQSQAVEMGIHFMVFATGN